MTFKSIQNQLNDSKTIGVAAGMSSDSLNEEQLGPIGTRRCKSYVVG